MKTCRTRRTAGQCGSGWRVGVNPYAIRSADPNIAHHHGHPFRTVCQRPPPPISSNPVRKSSAVTCKS